ncbi:hypothetical protein PV726_46930 [Streptomyces europaeiscabiei]|uniref:hypothetical protein n=1 Tax=Streptomyces europaeiscabiei TaxID=146819 RepID=UPI0029B8EABD|nr:hypothetical protein [Streptomyces europaeiscabiei]MDX3697596.1 hypothetical protein [Streptomyces europaeiscabiei]
MSTLEFTGLDLDFPVGSKNRTATLVNSEQEALPADAGLTPADGHRLASDILDSGKLTAGLRRGPYEITGFAASAPILPAEAVRRPYTGNTPAPTQKGLPQ